MASVAFVSFQTSVPSAAQSEINGAAPYPNLIVGAITAISTLEQSKALFLAGRKRGWWTALSAADPAEFAARIQPVSMALPSGKSITVLIATDEYRASPLRVGDLGRFAPHRHRHEIARPNDPYWVAVGCAIVLCRAGDAKCAAAYKPGIYRVTDGVELDASSLRPIPGGTVIDPLTMRPKPIP
ncbi:MAG: hypothetical protein ACREM8_08890 [Vulcanimicrobiaceae bacterium]